MDIWLKLSNDAFGRDKMARVLQYSCRVAWYNLEKNQATKKQVDLLKEFEYLLSTFRKLLRFGRGLDVIHSTTKIMSYEDVVIRFLVAMARISNSLFLFIDHYILLHRTGFIKIEIERWTKTAAKYWLFVSIMNLCRDFVEITRIVTNSTLIPASSSESPPKFYGVLYTCWMRLMSARNHRGVFIDTIKNMTDVLIPMNILGITNLSHGTVGCCGVIGSIAAAATIAIPDIKLIP